MASSARNSGWFRRGPDPRRHALTLSERRKGGVLAAMYHHVLWDLEQGFPLLDGSARAAEARAIVKLYRDRWSRLSDTAPQSCKRKGS